MATGSGQGGVDSGHGGAHDSESTPSLVGSMEFAFLQLDSALEAVVLAGDQRFKRELEEKEKEIDLLQLVALEKIKLEDELNKREKECAELRENLQFSNEQVSKYGQEVIMLRSRISVLDVEKSRVELDLDRLKLKYEYELNDHEKKADYEIGVWEKRFKELEGRVDLMTEDVGKLSGVYVRMDCEVAVKREVGQRVVLEERGVATENAEGCKHVSGDMRQEVGVGDSCLQELVNEDRLSASSGLGAGVRGAEDVRSKMCDKEEGPTENAEDQKQASGNMRQEVGVGDSCLQELVNEDRVSASSGLGAGVRDAEDVSKMCDEGGSDVKREAGICEHGEKIVSEASGDGGSSCKLIDIGNGMGAISGNEKRTLPQIIQIVDSDDEDGSCELPGNEMATKEHVDIAGSGQNVVGNENNALKRKQPASVNGDGDGGSQDNDQDFDNKSMSGRGTTLMKCQKLTPGTNAGGKDSTPSKLRSLFKSPIPAGKFNVDGLYTSDGSSSSSDSEDTDLQYEMPTFSIPTEQGNKDNKEWRSEVHMASAFQKEAELSMKAVCALYRHQFRKTSTSKRRGFYSSDASRGISLGKFLTGGDHQQGKLNRSVADLLAHDSRGVADCKRLAIGHRKQLFEIYQQKEDPLFFS